MVLLDVCLHCNRGILTSTERRDLLKGENEKIMAGSGHPPAEDSWRQGEGSRKLSHMLAVTFLIRGHRWVAGGHSGNITAMLLLAAPRFIC